MPKTVGGVTGIVSSAGGNTVAMLVNAIMTVVATVLDAQLLGCHRICLS
jgi:hypothetical protein